MEIAHLLRELEPLTHDARMRRLAEHGRDSRSDSRLAATLAELARGDVYERMLALAACFGSRDGAHAVRAASDSSRLIRRRSIRLVALCADDGQAIDALRAAPAGDRLALLQFLRRRGRTAPADALLDELAARDDEEIDRLVAYGSADGLARNFEVARRRGGSVFWTRLARLAPDLAARTLLERAEHVGTADDRLRFEANAALPALADARPDAALGLVIALARRFPLGQLALDPLFRRRPAAVADLLLASDDRVDLDLSPVAHRLDDDRLLALLRRRPRSLADRPRWLRRLAPERRRAAFECAGRSWYDAEGRIPADLACFLPRDLREAEGRRHEALGALATRPAERFPYAMLLPWEDARRSLDPWLGHPDGTIRAAALSAMAGTVRFHRDRLTEFLALAEDRRNEQDPVRLAMLRGLADLPPACWTAGSLESAGRILRAAFDAADLSHATAATAFDLIVRLLPRHPEWSATWLQTLVRERGQFQAYGLDNRLTDADARRIAPALTPILVAWRMREREPHLVALASSLGKRLRVFDALLAILEQVVRDTATQWVATSALALLAEHDRARFATLVPALVAEDPSWGTQATVHGYLHRRRQDLLTPFLGRQAYRGRFSTGRTRFVLPLTGGFFRWTPAQQATFASTLDEVTHLRDRLRDVPAILQAIGQLAVMPTAGPARLGELASDPRPAVRDAALRALGCLDGDQGVSLLLEAMGDDRARVAIYALRRTLLSMPAAHSLDVLRSVPMAKVTVAKEVVRLVGEIPGDESFALLREFASRSLHRDVRVALLRAFWGHLGRTETWDAFDQAATEPDPALVSGVVRIPADRLAPSPRRRLAALLLRLLDHPEPTVRLETLERCAAEPVGDPDRLLLARLLASARSPLPDEREAAASAIVAACTVGHAPRLAGAIQDLAADRRALRVIADALREGVLVDRPRLAPIVRAVLEALSADAPTASLRVELAAAALSGAELADWLAALAASGALHADALNTAVSAFTSAAQRPDAAGLDAVEDILARHPNDRLRRLALAALIAQAEAGQGWNADRLACLRAYRNDLSPLVAAPAQFTFPVEETVTEGSQAPAGATE